jgi:hypothetical protein
LERLPLEVDHPFCVASVGSGDTAHKPAVAAVLLVLLLVVVVVVAAVAVAMVVVSVVAVALLVRAFSSTRKPGCR